MSSDDRSLALRVARRRNEHLRRGSEFLSRLRQHAGWTASPDVQLMNPSRSIEFEAQAYTRLREGIASGSVTRWRHLPLEDAVVRCREVIARIGKKQLNVILCRNPEFIFCCPATVLAASLPLLIEFDGDSVTAAVHDASAGFALDVETEALPNASYEVDAWWAESPGLLRE